MGGSPAALITAPDETAPYGRDWLGRRQGVPLAVARPASAAEVAAVVRLCRAAGVGLLPQGGNTGLVGGSTPDAQGRQVLLNLSRMNRIRSIDPVGDIVVAEAGCTIAAVKAALEPHRRVLPFGIGSGGTAQIGGILSTNAGGHMALRYGTARDLVLGLEAVLPDGTEIAGPRQLRKDNTGFDVARLMIGAEGVLGIITAAALRLVPRPAETVTAFLGLPDMDAAMILLVRLREQAGHRLAAFEVMLAPALMLAMRHVPSARAALSGEHSVYALVEWDDAVPGPALRELAETLVGEAIETGLVSDAAMAESLDQRNQLWALRESLPEGQSKEGLSLKHDIALPLPQLARFMKRADREMRAQYPMFTPVVYGHAGDGNLHWNLQASTPAVADQERLMAETRQSLYDLVDAFGGSFSAEHGVGRAYLDHVQRRTLPGRVEAMRLVKRALDPADLMNPGAVVPP